MEIAIVIILILVAIGFFILEIFLLPGITIAGIAGGILATVAVWYAFAQIGTTAGILTIIVGSVAFGIAFWLFLKTKTLEKMSLTTKVTGKVENIEESSIKVGDKGVTISRLAPMGKVLINDQTVEARTYDDFIDQETEIIVKQINKTNVIVEKT